MRIHTSSLETVSRKDKLTVSCLLTVRVKANGHFHATLNTKLDRSIMRSRQKPTAVRHSLVNIAYKILNCRFGFRII